LSRTALSFLSPFADLRCVTGPGVCFIHTIVDKIPFGVYDFFAYLSSGTVMLVALDQVSRTGLLTQPHITPALAVVLVIAAYVVGHIVAHFSSFLLEHRFCGKLLYRPTTLLLGSAPHFVFLSKLFPNYHRALPASTRIRIREQAASRGFTAHGEALFLHAYALVTANEKAQARLDEFRNQYGFARNMSFAFIVSGLMLTIARYFGDSLSWMFILLVFGAGIALLYRYLKFFRQYSCELFLRYAELPKETQTKGE